MGRQDVRDGVTGRFLGVSRDAGTVRSPWLTNRTLSQRKYQLAQHFPVSRKDPITGAQLPDQCDPHGYAWSYGIQRQGEGTLPGQVSLHEASRQKNCR